MSATVIHQPSIRGFDEVEDCLLQTFRALAASSDTPSVVVLRDVDVAAQGEAAAAALAHGMLGLVRALAIEGFTVNALAVSDDDVIDSWVERLSDPQALSGQIVHLGIRGLGKVAP